MLRVEQNQRASLELRVDGFLDTDESGRSSAEEICEAVIRAAQREYEEKKIFFQGNLLGNIPFHPEVDSSQANLLVRLASELSYQQYCLLSLFMRPKEFDYVFNDSLSDDERETWNRLDAGEQAYSREQNTKQHQQELNSLSALMGTHHAIRQEVFGLYSLALIGTRNESGEGKLVTATQITYKYVYLSNFGRIFYELL